MRCGIVTEEKTRTWATACNYLSKAESAAVSRSSHNFSQTWLHHVVKHGLSYLSVYLKSPSHLQPFVSKPTPKCCQSERQPWPSTALHVYHLSLHGGSFEAFEICALWLCHFDCAKCFGTLALLFNQDQGLSKSTATAESPMTFYLFCVCFRFYR